VVNNVLIVGHGPSAKVSKKGNLINSFDFVVRQKQKGLALMISSPEYFGTKTDAVCGSIGQYPLIKYKNAERWIFVDSRYESVNTDKYTDCIIDKPFCNKWNEMYRGLRTRYEKPDTRIKRYSSSDDLGHKHVSSGFHTLLYACKFLNPNVVSLIGYDSLSTGEFTWSLIRGIDWDKYPDHRWDIEYSMLDIVKDTFNVTLEFL